MKLRFLFASMVLFLASTHAFAISNVFTYQGALTDAGNPANGVYDFQFQLKDAANANVGAPLLRDDVTVSAGVFTVELDFGTAITSSDFKMEIGVRPGASTDPHQVLAPLTALRPSPQAQIAGMAVEAATVSPGGVTNAMLANDAVNSAKLAPGAVTNSDLADGAVGASKVLSGEVQLRVGGTCAEGSSVRLINADGTVTCETDDNNAGGVTSVATGAGLTGGPITTTGTIAADTTYLQRRVSSSCTAGSSIRAIADDGTVTCESFWKLGGNSISDPNTQFIGTSNPQPFHIRSNGQNVSRMQANTLSIGQTVTGYTANIINGSPDNAVTAGVRGATIAGGGVPSGCCDPNYDSEHPNRVTDHYGFVGGGYGNRAGDNDADLVGSPFATVSGGQSNTASDTHSTVAGGQSNIAIAAHSTVAGGQSNTASASHSAVAGGQTNIAGGTHSNVAGGSQNTASSRYSNVAGGFQNVASGQFSNVGGGIANTADGHYGTVAGGQTNTANGNHSNVGGGLSNIAGGNQSNVTGGELNTASGLRSTVSGGYLNCAGGDMSWAGGRKAKVRPSATIGAAGSGCNSVTPSNDPNGDEGTFVWADSQDVGFESTGPNQFLVRASGGVVFNGTFVPEVYDDFVFYPREGVGDDVDFRLVTRNNKAGTFYVRHTNGTVGINAVHLTSGQPRFEVLGGTGGAATLTHGGAWNNASSRTYKENFAPSDGVEVLEKLVNLPIGTWTYIGSDEGTHLGPMAEDFKAAFGLAGDGKSIATVDADGVALAAIQGLNQKLESENAALKTRTENLERELQQLKIWVEAIRTAKDN